MADFTPIATLVKPQQQMTPNDVINLARGAQAYQQAQQINPLQVQEQQALTESAQQQALQNQTKTQSDQFKLSGDKYNSALNIIGSYAQDKRLQNGTPQQVQDVLSDISDQMKNRGFSQGEILTQLGPLATAARSHQFDANGQPTGALSTMIQTAVRNAAGPTNQLALQTPQFKASGNSVYSFTPGTDTISPVTLPSSQNPPQNAGINANAPDYMTPTPLSYPDRVSGMPVLNASPQEENDRNFYATLKNSLVQKQNNLPATFRNLNEALQANTDIANSLGPNMGVVRNLKEWFATHTGDPRYQQLAKDVANTYLDQQTPGAPLTNEGLAAKKIANGEGAVDPSVLNNILERSYTNATATDLQARGMVNFASKHGDANLNSWQQDWIKNAKDNRVFQAMNIVNQVKDPNERAKELNDLLGTDPKVRREFADKYQNIMNLVNFGTIKPNK